MNKFLILIIVLLLLFNFGLTSYVFAAIPEKYYPLPELVNIPSYTHNDIYYPGYKPDKFFVSHNLVLDSYSVYHFTGNVSVEYINNRLYLVSDVSPLRIYHYLWHTKDDYWYHTSLTYASYSDIYRLDDPNYEVVLANFTIPGVNPDDPPIYSYDLPPWQHDLELKVGDVFEFTKPPFESINVLFSSVGYVTFDREQVIGGQPLSGKESVNINVDSIIPVFNVGTTRLTVTDIVNPGAITIEGVYQSGYTNPVDPTPGGSNPPPYKYPQEYKTYNIPNGKTAIIENNSGKGLPVEVDCKKENIIKSGALYLSWHSYYAGQWVPYNDTGFWGGLNKVVPLPSGDRLYLTSQSGINTVIYPDWEGVTIDFVDEEYIYNPMDPSTDADKIDDNWTPGTIDNPNYNNNPYGPGGNIADFELGDFNRSMLDSFGAVQDMSGNVFTYFATGLSWIPKEWLLLGTLSLTIGLLAFIFGRK